jgi:hypothetical protein
MSVLGLLATAVALGLLMSKPGVSSAAPQPSAGRVRLENRTDIGVRIRCLGYEQEHNFTRDLARGQKEVVFGVDPGLRMLIVYEQGGRQIVAKKGFKLDAQESDADLVITGDKADGYKVTVTHRTF